MKELRDKRKNAGKIFYTRMDELRDLFAPCDIGEIILAAWDYEQFGIEYDFSNHIEAYPNISENIAMQVEYKNLVRDFKLLADKYDNSCEQKRANAQKRWDNNRANASAEQRDNSAASDNIAKELAQYYYKEQGIKTVRRLHQVLKSSAIHDADTIAAIEQEFTKLIE